ncbi:hypothetical protein LTS08_006841 [Lithohypha guttulata]|nr:hypothetical protein LTS08_006841 [Lithohypha guttulata]
MPLGLNDLGGVVKLAWRILNVGSSQYTSAPQEFTEFLGNVRTLATTLQGVEDVARSPMAVRDGFKLDSDFLQSTIKEARDTLNSCQKLITQNDHFKKSREGYVVNIIWAVTIKEHVRQQQDRIQVCFHKANFVLQRKGEGRIIQNQEMQLEVTQAGHGETHRLLRNIQARPGQPMVEKSYTELLSEAVSKRFAASIKDIPTIIQRLDAALVFCEAGTQLFEAEPPSLRSPTPAQYLNLLKTIWLIESVRHDAGYKSFCRKDPFNKAWASILENRVRQEARRFLEGDTPLDRVSDEELLRQHESGFDVNLWQEKQVPVPGPLEATGGEVLAMSTALKTRDQTRVEELRLFRLTENRLRLAIATSTLSQAQQVVTTVEKNEIDCHKVYLYPIYAMSANAAPSIIWKAAASDYSVQELAFTTLNNAREFQEHVINFKIRCDLPALVTARKKTGFFGQGKVCADGGRIQIWMYRNPLSDVQRSASVDACNESGATAPSTGSSSETGGTSGTWTEATLRSNNRWTSVRSGDGGAFLEEPVPSQVIILTETNNLMSAMSIRVDEYTALDPDMCHCSAKNSQCKEVVIVNKKEKLGLRTYTSKSPNEGWNVAVFGHSILKQRKGNGFKYTAAHYCAKELDEESAKFVSILFDTIEARKHFQERMELACRTIQNQVEAYHKDLRATERTTVYSHK